MENKSQGFNQADVSRVLIFSLLLFTKRDAFDKMWLTDSSEARHSPREGKRKTGEENSDHMLLLYTLLRLIN